MAHGGGRGERMSRARMAKDKLRSRSGARRSSFARSRFALPATLPERPHLEILADSHLATRNSRSRSSTCKLPNAQRATDHGDCFTEPSHLRRHHCTVTGTVNQYTRSCSQLTRVKEHSACARKKRERERGRARWVGRYAAPCRVGCSEVRRPLRVIACEGSPA